MDKTKQVISSMLQENTGRHLLDSGGIYGRHWERNQHRNFENEPESSLTVRWDYIEVVHNLYHWLADRLEFAEEMQRLFDGFVRWYDLREYEQGWMFYAEEFPEWLEKKFGVEISGLYGDRSGPFTVNTYNGEDLLSQTIQYVYFNLEEPIKFPNFTVWDGVYVILQIHGGCDVRGGYTAPKIFTPSGMDGTAILCNNDATIWVDSNDDLYWCTDDGHHWYERGCCGYLAGPQLETYDIVEADDRVDVRLVSSTGVELSLSLPARIGWRFAERAVKILNPPWIKVLDYELEPYLIKNEDGQPVFGKNLKPMYAST